MERTMILVGWKIDFACSAALVYHKIPDSDILGMSKRGLPEYLSKLADSKDQEYDAIYIMGIPLTENEQLIKEACRKLDKRKVKLLWLSSYPIPHRIPEGIEKYLIIPPVTENSLLCKLTASHLGISRKLSLYQAIENIAKYADSGKGEDAFAERSELIEAGMLRFRRFQDMGSFSAVIRLISRNSSLGLKEQKLLEEYRRFSRELKGNSKSVYEITKMAKKVGKEGDCGVLITGETGTGKETVANLIHLYSPRSSEPFIAFNCADLSPQLIESRLFGHEKGAFTGAEKQRSGAFEIANGGTLFLDEVAELPIGAQAGLLRVLQEGRFFRLGGEEEVSVNVRIIAATNRNLREMIEEGNFREDLFYRLNVINIHIPPLRERMEDIKSIADSYMLNRDQRKLKANQIKSLENFDWPGNVRELQNLLERSIVMHEYDFGKLLFDYKKSFIRYSKTSTDILDDAIKNKVNTVYEKYECNKTHAAKALGISINTLKKYLK